jgi:hypothetical protein
MDKVYFFLQVLQKKKKIRLQNYFILFISLKILLDEVIGFNPRAWTKNGRLY